MLFLGFRFLLTILLASLGSLAHAQKVNFDFGAYTIHADPPAGSSSAEVNKSAFGAYSISAHFELKQPLEIGVGYTVFYSRVLTGDMGFGPDFYLTYFPFNEGSGLRIETPQIQYHEMQQWRPFAFVAFHQRQFQSVQSAYSGFGAGLGTEWQWQEKTALRGLIRSISLAGPSNAKLNYLDFLFGFQIQF